MALALFAHLLVPCYERFLSNRWLRTLNAGTTLLGLGVCARARACARATPDLPDLGRIWRPLGLQRLLRAGLPGGHFGLPNGAPFWAHFRYHLVLSTATRRLQLLRPTAAMRL